MSLLRNIPSTTTDSRHLSLRNPRKMIFLWSMILFWVVDHKIYECPAAPLSNEETCQTANQCTCTLRRRTLLPSTALPAGHTNELRVLLSSIGTSNGIRRSSLYNRPTARSTSCLSKGGQLQTKRVNGIFRPAASACFHVT